MANQFSWRKGRVVEVIDYSDRPLSRRHYAGIAYVSIVLESASGEKSYFEAKKIESPFSKLGKFLSRMKSSCLTDIVGNEVYFRSRLNSRGKHVVDDPKDIRRADLYDLMLLLKDRLPKADQDHLFSFINALFRELYEERGLSLPLPPEGPEPSTHGYIVKECFFPDRVWHRVLELDFTSFYPTIVLDYGIYPGNDDHELYALMVEAAYLLKREYPRIPVKRFLALLCSGYLKNPHSLFFDPEAYRDVLEVGGRLMGQVLLRLRNQHPECRVVSVNTDGLFVSVEGSNIRSQGRRLVSELNKLVGGRYLRLALRGVWTHAFFVHVGKYVLFNSYDQERKHKGFKDETDVAPYFKKMMLQ